MSKNETNHVKSHMGVAFKCVANGEWRVFRDGQSIGRRKLGADVATSVTDNVGMIFEPQKEALFELATERLLDRRSFAHLEAGNPS